ncbi:hypothetical protein [Capnocytophaga sputigena]|uniref:Uncharacterized protein n=1 Tax=Capnocytophaga sputigena TaxID=1019 RepID=A0A250F9B5_CAPSP|nr:hypothetical protein [Capnocytophaga sputigena]ATA80627.1 hypothetical protein CGC59_13535 [Capnocytophaga sputigena]
MKVIHIQGAQNTGKTTLCNRIDEWLLNNRIYELQQLISSRKSGQNSSIKEIIKIEVIKKILPHNDFYAVYDIQFSTGGNKRVIINTLSDCNTITEFENFYNNNKNNGYDVFITTIRNGNTPQKVIKEFYEKELKSINLPTKPNGIINLNKNPITNVVESYAMLYYEFISLFEKLI